MINNAEDKIKVAKRKLFEWLLLVSLRQIYTKTLKSWADNFLSRRVIGSLN